MNEKRYITGETIAEIRTFLDALHHLKLVKKCTLHRDTHGPTIYCDLIDGSHFFLTFSWGDPSYRIQNEKQKAFFDEFRVKHNAWVDEQFSDFSEEDRDCMKLGDFYEHKPFVYTPRPAAVRDLQN